MAAPKHCPYCGGTGKEPEDTAAVCPVCNGDGKLWCAMCGQMGDHRSGGCPELRAPDTRTEGEQWIAGHIYESERRTSDPANQ